MDLMQEGHISSWQGGAWGQQALLAADELIVGAQR